MLFHVFQKDGWRLRCNTMLLLHELPQLPYITLHFFLFFFFPSLPLVPTPLVLLLSHSFFHFYMLSLLLLLCQFFCVFFCECLLAALFIYIYICIKTEEYQKNICFCFSSNADAGFDAVIGHIEDIIMGENCPMLSPLTFGIWCKGTSC